MSGNPLFVQVGYLARRSVLRTLRQPLNVVPSFVFPLILLAVNVGGLASAARIRGFPTDSYLDFALAFTFMQGALFATTNAGTDLARDIQTGFLNRLALTPMRGAALLLGQLAGVIALALLQATLYLTVGLIAGVRPKSGVLGIFLIVFLGVLIALAFGAIGAFLALRTGSGEAIQALFPLFFVFLFLSSMNLPRNLIEIDWFRTVATINPVSYLIEGIRSLIITGWDAEALALGFGLAAGIAVLALDGGEPGAQGKAGAVVRELRLGRSRGRLARDPQRVHEPVDPRALAALPALLLHGVRRRSLARLRRARVRLPRGLHGLPVRVRLSPVRRLRRDLQRLRDRAGLRERLRAPAPPRGAAAHGDHRRLRARRPRHAGRRPRRSSSPSRSSRG